MGDRLRVAAVFNQTKTVGGGFNEAVNRFKRLELIQNNNLEVIFVCQSNSDFDPNIGGSFQTLVYKAGLWSVCKRIFSKLYYQFGAPKYIPAIRSPFENFLRSNNVDLVYFLAPNSLAGEIHDINFIITVWDNCHRDEVSFPEIRNNGEFERREKYNSNVLPKALAIIVDSEYTKVALASRYSIDPHRFMVIPFQPSPFIRRQDEKTCNITLAKYGLLNEKFVFYPAQYWAHKNHIYLIEAIASLESTNDLPDTFKVVFCGADKGNLEYLKSSVKILKLEKRILFLNFIDDIEVSVFYQHCLAMVMPSYFGPSNMPPLEALKLGAPVVYPDTPENRLFLGDAALYVDLNNVSSLTSLLKSLLRDKSLKVRQKLLGFEQIQTIENSTNSDLLENLFETFRARLKCWRV